MPESPGYRLGSLNKHRRRFIKHHGSIYIYKDEAHTGSDMMDRKNTPYFVAKATTVLSCRIVARKELLSKPLKIQIYYFLGASRLEMNQQRLKKTASQSSFE